MGKDELSAMFSANQIAVWDDGVSLSMLKGRFDEVANAFEACQRCEAEGAEARQRFKEYEQEVAIRMEVAGGDILVPVCCIPFCCLSGRQHILSDSQIIEMVSTMDIEERTVKDITKRLQIGEGVDLDMLDELGVPGIKGVKRAWHRVRYGSR